MCTGKNILVRHEKQFYNGKKPQKYDIYSGRTLVKSQILDIFTNTKYIRISLGWQTTTPRIEKLSILKTY